LQFGFKPELIGTIQFKNQTT